MNYFSLLQIPEQYDINIDLLNRKYFSMQQSFHPDLAESQEEKNSRLNKSIEINKAYNILKDNYLRAKYLLKIRGHDIDNLKITLDSNYLENIFQQFDNIVEIGPDELDEKLNSILREEEELEQKLSDSFANNNLPLAVDLTIKLKYLSNLVRTIKLRLRNGVNSN